MWGRLWRVTSAVAAQARGFVLRQLREKGQDFKELCQGALAKWRARVFSTH